MAVASLTPPKKTASRCSPATAQCTHTFEVASYSLYKDLPAGEPVRSASFAVGGLDWRLTSPTGTPLTEGEHESKDHVSVYLSRASKATGDVKVLIEFRLVDQTTGI